MTNLKLSPLRKNVLVQSNLGFDFYSDPSNFTLYNAEFKNWITSKNQINTIKAAHVTIIDSIFENSNPTLIESTTLGGFF